MLIRIWIASLLMLMVSCQQQEEMDSWEEAVELTFKLDLKDKQSRADSELVDGGYLQNVSVYLLNNSEQIVAKQENISVPNKAKTIVVTFDRSYDLKRGLYTLMAVANHAPTWNFNSYTYLMNNFISTEATDNISSKDVVQPLSLMKEIELHAGKNQVEGELVRTFARFRIEVQNNSGDTPLRVNSLTFSNNFTQQKAYVFDDGTDRKYSHPAAAPLSTSTHAIQPFVKDNGANYKTIPARGSAVLYDSYILESKAASGSKFTYTMDLAYVGVSQTTTIFRRESNTALDQTSELNVGEESYFLIYNTKSGGYLNASGTNVDQSTLSDFNSLGTHSVWQLIVNGNSYYIKNVETGTYMQKLEKNSTVIKLGSNPVAFTLKQKEVKSGRLRYYYIQLVSNSRYVSVDGQSVPSTTQDNDKTYFHFYKVVKNTSTVSGENITFNDPIPLTTINPVTQQSSVTTAIKRNDFIHVLVTVSYNPIAGKFEFKVEDWSNVTGDVEFY